MLAWYLVRDPRVTTTRQFMGETWICFYLVTFVNPRRIFTSPFKRAKHCLTFLCIDQKLSAVRFCCSRKIILCTVGCCIALCAQPCTGELKSLLHRWTEVELLLQAHTMRWATLAAAGCPKQQSPKIDWAEVHTHINITRESRRRGQTMINTNRHRFPFCLRLIPTAALFFRRRCTAIVPVPYPLLQLKTTSALEESARETARLLLFLT